ncbi:hypothetical protein CDAR_296761 [Caerostris darwini]|uniref:Secreted protein n=1 Tax=Caerostris darwini TaxID=1538125 RepID=A0AAV4N6E2_9ARAC|nr:hypothetical protein CDAR_296761 [Caerostris darwini]
MFWMGILLASLTCTSSRTEYKRFKCVLWFLYAEAKRFYYFTGGVDNVISHCTVFARIFQSTDHHVFQTRIQLNILGTLRRVTQYLSHSTSTSSGMCSFTKSFISQFSLISLDLTGRSTILLTDRRNLFFSKRFLE